MISLTIFAILWFLVLFNHGISSASLPSLQLPNSNSTTIIWTTAGPKNSPSPPKDPWIQGTTISNRSRSISGQAMGGILIQSLYQVYNLRPDEVILGFEYTMSEQHAKDNLAPSFEVTIGLKSTRLPAPFQLTNGRLVEALGTLGGSFQHHWDVNQLKEWDFDIGLLDRTLLPHVREQDVHWIARGSIITPPRPFAGSMVK